MTIYGSINFYINGVPTLSNYIVNQLPTSIDQEVGQQVSNIIIQGAPIDVDKTELIKQFYNELNFDSKTKVYVVKANVFNAFSLPDNSIFIFDKVLHDVNSYSELSALLGHEYSHIKFRHGMKALAQSLSWELLRELITGGDNSDKFVRNSNLLLTLKNSRKFETEADFNGLQLLRQQRIDQKGMTDLFKTIMKQPEENENKTPTYLSTHPDTEERLVKAEETIKDNPSEYSNNARLDELFGKLKADN